MKLRFDVIFLTDAIEFIAELDDKTRKKIIYNIDKAKMNNDPKLFKKLKNDIWEFRTLYNQKQYRLFAFWDKTEKSETLVISTHGIIKKVSKVSTKEIAKVERIRIEYFKIKNSK